MKHFDAEFKMNGQQRGFRVSGRKLLPRDAAECQYGKSYKERRRAIAAERVVHERQDRAYLESIGCEPSRTEAQVDRTRMALSERRAKPVEELFVESVNGDSEWAEKIAKRFFGRAQWRYWKALRIDWSAKAAQDADGRLLSYARG